MRADRISSAGVYRDVSLIFVPENHISVSHYASSGSIFQPECDRVSQGKDSHHLTLKYSQKADLEQQIIDPKGNAIATLKHPSACTRHIRLCGRATHQNHQSCTLGLDSPNNTLLPGFWIKMAK